MCIFAPDFPARDMLDDAKKALLLTVLSQEYANFYEGGRSILLLLVAYAVIH